MSSQKPNLTISIPVALKYKMKSNTSPNNTSPNNTSPNNTSPNNVKVFPESEYTMNFDGASRGNPGPAGIGAVIFHNGQEIWAACQYIGTKTNNQSEYSALILGLKEALTRDIKCLHVYGDSQLVINQIIGQYKVKNPGLQELYQEVQGLKTQFETIAFTHIYREFNKRADHLSNMALDVLDTNVNTGLQLPLLTSPSPLFSPLLIEKEKPVKKEKQSIIKSLLFPNI
jgi:ribonuclease HI